MEWGDDPRVERELMRREWHRNEMDTEVWVHKFPDVSFTDKVCVEFGDGSARVFKHLYHDDSELHEVDWQQVVAVYEV
jgi:hypothetical protein